ncbi:phage tail tape measure protein [Clostridium sp.]|uniref:phage tail tape measure protein n=1 Tax=Clostridium sp. TaxID=1506 RepID=UPI0025B9DA67|nr:phage tail tape measure protein [Clostridium sp.]
MNNYAIGVGDITEALRSSSANLAMTNTSLEQSVGLITASYEVLQDSGRVGNGLKTISMRVQNYSKDLEKMGVSVYDATGKVRSLYDVMLDASKIFNNLKAMGKDAQAYSLLDKLGGRQQGAVVASILQNIKTMESAYNTAMNSMGSATREQERLMNSIDAKTNALKENLLGMWLDISNSSAIKGFVDNVNDLVTSLRNSESVAKGFSTAFNGISSVLNGLVKGVGWLTDTFGFFETVVAGIVAKLTLTNTKFKNFADNIANCIPGVKKVKDGITELGVKLLSSAENTQEAINAQKQFMAQANLSKTATANASLQLVALNAKMALCKVGAIALQGAVLALNTAISMGLSWAITAGIGAINNLIHAQENLKQSNDEYLESLKNGDTFNASGAEKALASYKKLSQELSNLTPNTEEYKNKEQELVEVKNQLIALLPEAEQLFANSAEAKGLDIQATEELIEKERELTKAKAYEVLDDNKYKDKSSVQKEILEYEALQEQIKLANKLREEGKKTGYAKVSEDYNGTGKLATSARDADVYAERLERSESKLRAFYEAMNQLDDGSGKFSEEMKMISDTLGIVDETLQNTTNTANNTDLSNIVDQFEEGAESAGNFEDAIKELQDSFSGFQDGIDLLSQMIEEFQQYGVYAPYILKEYRKPF